MQPNVLIVDDDLGTLQILQQYLDDMADVGIVSGGREALQYVQHHHVDIIFLDINMPMMNGFKTLEQFRNLKESINVPVVFITGRSDKATVMNSALMGVDGYLRKPIDRDTIREKVMEIWQNQEKKENRKTILAIDDDMAYCCPAH